MVRPVSRRVRMEPSHSNFCKDARIKNESMLGAFLGNFLVGVALPALLMLVVVCVIWVRKSFIRDITKEKGTRLLVQAAIPSVSGV